MFAENFSGDSAGSCVFAPPRPLFSLSVPEGSPVSLPQPFSNPCTLATALAKYTDLLSPPPGALEALHQYRPMRSNVSVSNWVLHQQMGKMNMKRSSYLQSAFFEVLESFPSAVPPSDCFLELSVHAYHLDTIQYLLATMQIQCCISNCCSSINNNAYWATSKGLHHFISRGLFPSQ